MSEKEIATLENICLEEFRSLTVEDIESADIGEYGFDISYERAVVSGILRGAL